jgi:nucleoside-diphosphate kinase
MTQYTFAMLKPDAIESNIVAMTMDYFEEDGLEIAALKMAQLTKEQVEKFYAIHKDRPFFNDLVEFMISGPVVLMVLKGDEAVARARAVIGATNPDDAEEGTIRGDLSESIDKNTVHGSDSEENAHTEIAFFFTKEEIVR